jgi:hypothetical protein
MNRKDAIDIINRYIPDKSEGPVLYEALLVAAGTLSASENPWVRTAERLPEGKDAFEDKVLVYNYVEKRQQLKLWLTVRTYPHVFPYWMPIPPLPEKEEQEPWPGDGLDCPNCGAMLELVDGGMLECRLCGFSDNDTAEVEE